MYIECNHSDEKLALEYEIPDLPLAAPTGRMRVMCECGRTGRWARSVVGAVREWDNRDYDTTKAHLETFRRIYARAIQNDNATVWEAELHLENLILNLRADFGVLRRERDAYRDALREIADMPCCNDVRKVLLMHTRAVTTLARWGERNA